MANSNRTEIYIEGSKEAIGQIIEEQDHDLDESEWDEEIEAEGEQEYDRNFWEEVVDPAFTVLQERLDKVMREI